jgi:hypothetical protein
MRPSPPPPMPEEPFSFLHRVFGPPPPRPFMRHGMFPADLELRDQEHIRVGGAEDTPPAHKRGCKGRMPLLARLRSMLPPPPFPDFAPPQRVNGFFFDGPRHAEHEGLHGLFRRFNGPFLRARFNLDFNEHATPEESDRVEAEELPRHGDEDAEIDAPTPEETAQAQEAGFVAPHSYAQTQDSWNEQPTQLSDAIDSDAHDGHRRHHRAHWLRWSLIALGVAVTLFAVFMLLRRRRLLRAAHQKPAAVMMQGPPAPMQQYHQQQLQTPLLQ